MPAASPMVVQLWTLYAVAVVFTAFRAFARVKTVGWRNLHADDFLIWLAVIIYTAQCTLGYNLGLVAHGLANNGMTDEERTALLPSDPEYAMRVIGSKIQVAGWTSAVCLLWTLKLCMAFFYLRLTDGLDRYSMRVHIAMGIIGATFIANIMTIYLSCRPFHHYWQINPNPGNSCQAAISKPIVWSTFVSNVATDVMLLLIPLPMLWKSRLRLAKKIATTLVLGAGVAVIACAILKSIYVIIDPVKGGLLAAEWGTRETFIAVITTNLPMIFPLLKTYVAPFLPSTLRSSRPSRSSNVFKAPARGFVSIGGSGRSGFTSSATRTFDGKYTSDDEPIVQDVEMQSIAQGKAADGMTEILVEKQVDIVTEQRGYSSERSTEQHF